MPAWKAPVSPMPVTTPAWLAYVMGCAYQAQPFTLEKAVG